MKTIIFILLLLSACTDMTNDQVIVEVKKCRDAGMDMQTVHNGLTYSIIKVVCVPKKD